MIYYIRNEVDNNMHTYGKWRDHDKRFSTHNNLDMIVQANQHTHFEKTNSRADQHTSHIEACRSSTNLSRADQHTHFEKTNSHADERSSSDHSIADHKQAQHGGSIHSIADYDHANHGDSSTFFFLFFFAGKLSRHFLDLLFRDLYYSFKSRNGISQKNNSELHHGTCMQYHEEVWS
jgi:hypothetical protein